MFCSFSSHHHQTLSMDSKCILCMFIYIQLIDMLLPFYYAHISIIYVYTTGEQKILSIANHQKIPLVKNMSLYRFGQPYIIFKVIVFMNVNAFMATFTSNIAFFECSHINMFCFINKYLKSKKHSTQFTICYYDTTFLSIFPKLLNCIVFYIQNKKAF